jgi:hypothetical protein
MNITQLLHRNCCVKDMSSRTLSEEPKTFMEPIIRADLKHAHWWAGRSETTCNINMPSHAVQRTSSKQRHQRPLAHRCSYVSKLVRRVTYHAWRRRHCISVNPNVSQRCDKEHDRKHLYDALAAIRNVHCMLLGDFTLVQHHRLAAAHPVL